MKNAIFVLQECVFRFNNLRSGKNLGNIVMRMAKLAKIINPDMPSIPPFKSKLQFRHLSFPSFSSVGENEVKTILDLETTTNMGEGLKNSPVFVACPCLKLNPHQDEPTLTQLLSLSTHVTLHNLTSTAEELMRTLFKLVKYRKTGVIINLLSGENTLYPR